MLDFGSSEGKRGCRSGAGQEDTQCEAFYSGEGSKIGNLVQNRGKEYEVQTLYWAGTALRVQTVQDRTFGMQTWCRATCDMLILA